MQLSGHKIIGSLDHYNIASKDQQRKMSNMLNNAPVVNNDEATDIASNDDWIGSLFHGATIKDNVILILLSRFSSNLVKGGTSDMTRTKNN